MHKKRSTQQITIYIYIYIYTSKTVMTEHNIIIYTKSKATLYKSTTYIIYLDGGFQQILINRI